MKWETGRNIILKREKGKREIYELERSKDREKKKKERETEI